MRAVGEMQHEDEVDPQERLIDVRLDGVSKRFGDVWALRPTELSVRRGEFFSLLGASGSGKTTTLRIIGGFEEPTTGRVYLRDRDVTGSAPYERPVNTVFQDYALFPHMSVADNVAYGMKVQRVPKEARRRRTAAALDLVRLSGLDRRRPGQLSGGQRQRVALARALVNAPAVLLLDEPLGALDLKLRREMQMELKRIQQDVGITFIYVTHDQEEAMSMSDRIAVMRDGRVEQIGAPSEVYERPANAFVAGFVGISNILHGTVRERDGQRCRVDVPGVGTLTAVSGDDVLASREGLITIRPEKIAMAAQRAITIDGNTARGRVTDVSYLGAFTRYTVRVGDETLSVLAQNNQSGSPATAGEEVWLTWPAEQTLLLSGSDGDLSVGIQASANE
jgi:spermidine/putrescine transport system ATP-binding protein